MHTVVFLEGFALGLALVVIAVTWVSKRRGR